MVGPALKLNSEPPGEGKTVRSSCCEPFPSYINTPSANFPRKSQDDCPIVTSYIISDTDTYSQVSRYNDSGKIETPLVGARVQRTTITARPGLQWSWLAREAPYGPHPVCACRIQRGNIQGARNPERPRPRRQITTALGRSTLPAHTVQHHTTVHPSPPAPCTLLHPVF